METKTNKKEVFESSTKLVEATANNAFHRLTAEDFTNEFIPIYSTLYKACFESLHQSHTAEDFSGSTSSIGTLLARMKCASWSSACSLLKGGWMSTSRSPRCRVSITLCNTSCSDFIPEIKHNGSIVNMDLVATLSYTKDSKHNYTQLLFHSHISYAMGKLDKYLTKMKASSRILSRLDLAVPSLASVRAIRRRWIGFVKNTI